MGHPAFEIYAGNVDAIRAACADDRLEDLRAGKVTPYFALFPVPFTASDIQLVEHAVAAITGSAEPLELDRVELDGCLFVDTLAPPWVASVAALGLDSACSLQQAWARAYEVLEGEPPEWGQVDQLRLMAQFLSICRKAAENGLDVVMVWIL